MVQGDLGGGGGPILRKSNFLEHLGKSKSSLNFKRRRRSESGGEPLHPHLTSHQKPQSKIFLFILWCFFVAILKNASQEFDMQVLYRN